MKMAQHCHRQIKAYLISKCWYYYLFSMGILRLMTGKYKIYTEYNYLNGIEMVITL